jgi:hypothetical protein
MDIAQDDVSTAPPSLIVRAAARMMGPAPPPVSTRLRIWRNRHELDRRLAKGEFPSGDLAVRAEQLSRLRYRDRIAARFEAIVALGELPRQERPVADIDIADVADARRHIDMLAARLGRPEPVRAAGVAMCVCLLSDDHSPLYEPTSHDQLCKAVRSALAALD